MKTIFRCVILALEDVLHVLMQFFTNPMTCCLKCVKSYLRQREEGTAEHSCLFHGISDIILEKKIKFEKPLFLCLQETWSNERTVRIAIDFMEFKPQYLMTVKLFYSTLFLFKNWYNNRKECIVMWEFTSSLTDVFSSRYSHSTFTICTLRDVKGIKLSFVWDWISLSLFSPRQVIAIRMHEKTVFVLIHLKISSGHIQTVYCKGLSLDIVIPN